MFIPIWVLHILVTAIFFVVLFGWALKERCTWDLMLPARGLVTLLGYSIYWIVFLIIKVCSK